MMGFEEESSPIMTNTNELLGKVFFRIWPLNKIGKIL